MRRRKEEGDRRLIEYAWFIGGLVLGASITLSAIVVWFAHDVGWE